MPLIVPRKVRFSASVMDRMWEYVDDQVAHLLSEGQAFRTSVLPEWTRLLKGEPKEKTRNFPFANASNLVVQLIATRVEQLLSRMMVMWMVDPLFAVTAMCDLVGKEAEDQAAILSQFLSDMAIDPEELNLYRKEELMFHDGIAYGTAVVGFPWQYITESQCVSISGENIGLNRKDEFRTLIKKEGPAPKNVSLKNWLVSNKVTDLDKARFIAERVPLTREAIEDRIEFGVWPKDLGEKILASPDAYGQDSVEAANDDKELQSTGNKYDAIYYVYECHFKFTHDGQTFSIIAHYHPGTKARLNAVYNYFPKNILPYEDYRFGYDAESYRGYGYIEMLNGYQEEVSQIHNNRLDNEMIRNTASMRANKGSELASKLTWYPGMVIPADKDEVEPLNFGFGNIDNGQSEQLSISMTNERSGIDPAIMGSGSGIVNSKRGIYSSQGTLAVLQQQNNRSGLRMMDARMVHTRIGRKLLDIYAFMGAGSRPRRYGAQAETLIKALASVKAGSLGLLIRPTTSGNNSEADRQNSILLSQLQEKYFGTMNSLLQMAGQAQNDPNMTKYIQDVLFAENAMAKHVFRIFGHYDVDKLVPFPEAIKNARYAAEEQGNTARQVNRSPDQIQNSVPFLSGANYGAVPSGNPVA